LSLICVTQIAGASEFSLDVATTVLRCYQLQPSSANKELIAKTLLRALMQLPRPDYKICIHLLPERLVVSQQRRVGSSRGRCCCVGGVGVVLGDDAW
jgi:hypothetical protein